MRIVHVITKGDVGGAQTHVVELATAQADLDEVIVVAGSDGPALERIRSCGIATEVVPALGAAWSDGSVWAAYRDLRRRLVSFGPDIVHGHSSHGGLVSRACARSMGVPSVYTAHGWPFQSGAPIRQRAASYLGESLGAWLGDAVICLTESEAAKARFVVPRRRRWVVPNGIADVAEDHTRKPGAVSDEPVALVMVARFAPPKQQLELIELLTAITDLAWTLTFIGDGPECSACEETARDRFPDGRVTFLGHRDDVPALLASHDVAILWSGYEGMPIALLEAMRAGLCCVASDLPGVRALFGAPPAGIVAAGGSELVGALRQLLVDRPCIDRLGVAARDRYRRSFTAQTMMYSTRAVYESVMSGSRRDSDRAAEDFGDD